jgi:cyclin H
MATEDARYQQSSQYRLWSFSTTQLAALREKTNSLARSGIGERLASQPVPPPLPASSSLAAVMPADSGTNTPDPEGAPGGGNGNGNALPEFLTPAEEATVVAFYTSELIRAGDHVGTMSDDIKATAAAFFRRFYVNNSVMTYPPTDMLMVALFFGCKAEGDFRSISR